MVDKLLQRIYEWRLQSIYQQVSDNFSLLRRIKNQRLLWSIEYLDSLTYDEKIQSLEAFVRMGTKPEILKEYGLDPSEVDQDKFRNLLNYCDDKTHSIYLKALGLTKSSSSKDLTPKIVREAAGIENIKKATFSRLKSKIVKPLVFLLGEAKVNDNSGLIFEIKVDENIFLSIHFSNGGDMQICMSQKIISLPIFPSYERNVLSVALPMRIGLGFTEWDMLAADDYDDFQEVVILFVNELLENLSVLLKE